MRKYRNKPCVIDGIRFDSKKEAARYSELKLLEKAGDIQHLTLQPKFGFAVDGEILKYKSGRPVIYKADFSYWQDGKEVVEDVKGVRTPAYRLKWAMMKLINKIEVKET